MDCAHCREALSDVADGRADATVATAVDAHLVACAACQAYRDDLQALQRAVRLRPAEPVPDQTAPILARARPRVAGRGDWIRYGLAVVALGQLALAVPGLLLGDDAGTADHLARHVGSLAAAMAIGLLYAAWRPERAIGLLPIAAALAVCMAVTAVADVVEGRVGVLAEAAHLLEVAGLAFLWVLAGSPRPHLRPLIAGGRAAAG